MTEAARDHRATRARVAELLRWQEAGCRLSASPSPFYAALLDRLAESAEAGGPVVDLLVRAPLTVEAAAPLRLLGGFHRAVLDGAVPELAATWPGDVDATWAVLEPLLADPPAAVVDALARDPQTNEVGRAAGLVAGLALTARRTGLPLRLFEIGSSAGLILRLDRYWYAAGAEHWGDDTAAVRFDGDTYDVPPPLGAMTDVVARRGCDLHPIDATTVDGQRRLLSYVWPDQEARLERLRGALAIAEHVPVAIDRASADDWVDAHVQPLAGTTTVLLHSIMWQYLPDEVQARVTETLQTRGAAATSDAPLAWVRLEPAPKIVYADVRVTLWPGGEEEVVATSGFHGPPVRWLGT